MGINTQSKKSLTSNQVLYGMTDMGVSKWWKLSGHWMKPMPIVQWRYSFGLTLTRCRKNLLNRSTFLQTCIPEKRFPLCRNNYLIEYGPFLFCSHRQKNIKICQAVYPTSPGRRLFGLKRCMDVGFVRLQVWGLWLWWCEILTSQVPLSRCWWDYDVHDLFCLIVGFHDCLFSISCYIYIVF